MELYGLWSTDSWNECTAGKHSTGIHIQNPGMSFVTFPITHPCLRVHSALYSLCQRMRKQILFLRLISLSDLINAEERLSWFTTDPEIKKSIFVPENLPEGKEENRVFPWVFHDNEKKLMELKCIMRGYNASNNPSDYKDAKWSYPGFHDSQVDKSVPAVKKEENGEPYAIWTIKITTSGADAGKKWVTCEFQQGDFPLSTDFKFLIFRKLARPNKHNKAFYELGGILDEKDITKQVEDDIKRQISEHYNMSASTVSRSANRKKFLITFAPPPIEPVVVENDQTSSTTTANPTSPATTTNSPTFVTPFDWFRNLLVQIVNIVFVQFNPFYHVFIGSARSIRTFN